MLAPQPGSRHVECQLPNQGSNPYPLQWKRGVLPTGLQGSPKRYLTSIKKKTHSLLIKSSNNKRLKVLVTQSCPTCDPMDCSPTRLLCPWNSLGKNTGVSCHFLLQGIFPTQGLNLGLPHCRQTLYQVSHQGSL